MHWNYRGRTISKLNGVVAFSITSDEEAVEMRTQTGAILFRLCVAGLLSLFSSPALHAQTAASRTENPSDYNLSEYTINTGDRVSIKLYDEPDLDVDRTLVKGDGTVVVPLIGRIAVSGMTVQQAARLVEDKFRDGYLKKPHASVTIDQYRLYFIKGEVIRPGGYSYVERLTVQKAVALAGGFTARAAERDISLVRETRPDRPLEDVGHNTPVFPGDIITIGESFF